MELYTLDPLLRRRDVIDKFESLIWTERYSAHGDFQLDIPSTFRNRSLLRVGTQLAMNESHRIMTVESIGDEADNENRKMLTVKGRSIEAILYDRVAKESISDLTTSPKWTITDQPADIIRKIFHDICVLGTLDVNDIIPFVVEGSFMPSSGIAEPTDEITVEIEPTPVYSAVTEIAQIWSLGFRLLRHFDQSQLYFDVYTGSDRTSSQTILPAVIFTPELDNLQNTKSFISIEQAKNVAYVYSPAGFLKVYAPGVDPSVEGFERRVLTVNASDITSDNPDVPAALLQRGNAELAKARTFQAFDGEISQNSQYKYGVHYNLGDLLEVRGNDGNSNKMRATEQIFVSDREGEKSYPTLTMDTFITAGSWLSWTNNQVWSDMGPTEYWATQP